MKTKYHRSVYMVFTLPSGMSNLQKTRITITNIKDNEVLHYPLVLLKGSIQHHNCNESSKANANDSAPKPSTTNFKVLIELKPGENNVNIDFCCSSVNMKLAYKRRKSPLTVVPLYIINDGHGGQFQSSDAEDNSPQSACKRILTGTKLLQCLIAEKLYEEGLGRKTFQVENDECVIFRSKLDYRFARRLTQEELWEYIGREIMNSKIGSEDKKYLGFLSCTRYNGDELIETYEEMIKMTEGHIALGGGGLALLGSACLYTWPEKVDDVPRRFEDDTLVDKHKFMDDSSYRGTYGTCFTTTLGAALHELCHTFDLAHTQDGIMSRGFDNIHKFFTVANKSPDIAKIESKSYQSILIVKALMRSNGTIRNRNRAQTNHFRRKPEDDTYFTTSCSVALYYHKYFNDFPSRNSNYVLKYERGTNFVKSTLGIRVIEIRKGMNQMVDHNWVFCERTLKFSFYLPKNCLSDTDMIFIQDNAGNILKEFYEK